MPLPIENVKKLETVIDHFWCAWRTNVVVFFPL